MQKKTFIVGYCGSGKSTLAHTFENVLSTDELYVGKGAIDWDLFCKDLYCKLTQNIPIIEGVGPLLVSKSLKNDYNFNIFEHKFLVVDCPIILCFIRAIKREYVLNNSKLLNAIAYVFKTQFIINLKLVVILHKLKR